MLSKNINDRIRRLTSDLIDCPDGRVKHFTFLLNKNRIISVGWNRSFKTHPKGKELGYRFSSFHSELDAVIRSRRPMEDLFGVTVVNTRINIFGQFGMSKPCVHCMRLLESIRPRNVFFTDSEGNWNCL